MKTSFLGTGWGFPPVFDRNAGQVKVVADEKDIEQSLHILLGTRPGERLLRPEFGINLDELLFEPISSTLLTSVKDQIMEALTLYEPRIEVLNLSLEETDPEAGVLLIEIEYLIRTTNSRFNFVYPFYINERTESI